MKRRLSPEHRARISKSMRGKNTGPRTPEVRAAISATKRAGADRREWRRIYRERLAAIRLAGSLRPA